MTVKRKARNSHFYIIFIFIFVLASLKLIRIKPVFSFNQKVHTSINIKTSIWCDRHQRHASTLNYGSAILVLHLLNENRLINWFIIQFLLTAMLSVKGNEGKKC